MWKCLLALGGLVFLVIVVFIISGPPGCQDTIDEGDRPKRPDTDPSKPLAVFRLDWNSEGPSNWPVAERLAQMSSSAYLDEEAARTAYSKLGFATSLRIAAGSMVADVVKGEDVAVVVFRGTDADDWNDWMVNFDRAPKETIHGLIHQGFADAFATLEPRIVGALQASEAKYVWVTGHSLGGALGLVCVYEFTHKKRQEITGLVTFGQPMVARKKLADYLDDNLLGRYAHFVNEADAVPRLPPSYSHCGSLVWFKDGGIKRSRPKRVYGSPRDRKQEDVELPPMTEAEFQDFKRQISRPKAQQRTPDGVPTYEGNMPWIRDHSMELYLEKIRKMSGPGAIMMNVGRQGCIEPNRPGVIPSETELFQRKLHHTTSIRRPLTPLIAAWFGTSNVCRVQPASAAS
jgi:triacylglycerol lipase